MNSLLLYLFFIFGGVGFEVLTIQLYFFLTNKKSKSKEFSILRYSYLLLIPAIGTAYMIYQEGMAILQIFLVFSILGPIFEWLVGFSYYCVVGDKLWHYKRFSLFGHSSLLTIPLWGFAGVLFHLIASQLS